ncbi:RIMS-binding protein 2 isoform X3 [Prionailurus bengalensis]|uniref:RIMS-binding protein 2 isoform X3 n=1 Tax=Prionailurus bengalensis TaxID=37029 RepID=UPI001CA82339|nr:RIMS-binding protein 2 isoform X3 [Prionailurus bengalensis]
MRESPDPCLQAVGVCRQTQFLAFRCGPRCTVSNLHNRGRERGPCFTIAWSGCVHLAPQAPQAPLWLAAYPRLRRASRLRQACQVMLNPLRPPPPPPPENCHSWSHPRACWETLILSCCDHKPTSFGGLLVSSMRPIHKVICILLGGISSVVLINSERSPLVGAGTASLGGRLWSCTVSMMRASREKELKDAIQGKHHLRPHYAGLPARGWQPHKVKTEHAWLQHVLAIVTRERDLAVREKRQLQAKLENLEQVLKHMREAAERRQQLELEHEQALAVLHAKQQEIDLLQKAQVEAKKKHEGAVQLLESKVRELEEKCRTQSEQFSLLSQDLERLRQHAGKIDLLGVSPGVSVDVPAPGKPFPQFMNGLSPSIGKGQESTVGSRTVTGDYIRPLPLPGDKPEPLPIKPTFLSRSASPRCRFESDMDNEHSSSTSKQQRHSGKVHLCVARYSYNPFDGPNENPEAELPLTAGKYLYVYGDMDEDGFYEGELLDGQRGLVPSNFVDFVQDNESRPASTLGNEQDQNLINRSGIGSEGENILDLHAPTPIDAGVADGGAETLGVSVDDVGEDIVPYPRKITLIKQLARSVIVAWEPPAVPPGWGTVSSYSVLVDQEPRVSLTLGSRTKALIEKLDTAACTYRISVQCATSRGHSDELRCTLLVGKDVAVAPSQLRVDNITQISAQLSWLPANSNYSHVIFLNEEELDVVRAASYTYQFFNLRPNVAYKVKVLARPHQMPWQLPLEQREKKEAFVEFSTLPAGPPAPPQDVTVHAGPTSATVQVSWKPPALTTAGLSNGANVTGYGVYAKGQRVAEVISPVADSAAVELVRLRSLEAKAVTVRTLSAQGESVDSAFAAIPPDLLVPPTPYPRTAPTPKPLASAGAPDTKEEHPGPHIMVDEAWEQSRAPAPAHGHMLEPPSMQGSGPGRRSPSPSRILPQPQGTPVSTSVAKAMAREAAQRVAESSRLEKRSIFLERGGSLYVNSDEEDGYGSPDVKRRGASVDDFLRGSELGKQPHCCHGDEYHTESSRGSDLSDIMEEDEEELCSETQLEDGGRRRPGGTSHNALKILGNPVSAGRADRADHAGRRFPHGSAGPQRSRPVMVPSIDEYSERDHLSPDFYEESETDPGTEELPARIFVALFDYDPLTMSPNPDAAEEELPFKEGQIIKVYGDKDADGFYRGETCARLGLIPCNMVSEIQADDEDMMDQLLRQGFLPLNTPVEKIERSRRGGRHPGATRRVVALYDYDPRESSPNIDVEAELTFCTGDIITVFGEIDEDGFYYGELNGQKGLVPSNFLEEVPDDVEVYLSDAPCHYSRDAPPRSKAKRKKSVHFTP